MILFCFLCFLILFCSATTCQKVNPGWKKATMVGDRRNPLSNRPPWECMECNFLNFSGNGGSPGKCLCISPTAPILIKFHTVAHLSHKLFYLISGCLVTVAFSANGRPLGNMFYFFNRQPFSKIVNFAPCHKKSRAKRSKLVPYIPFWMGISCASP